jgi:hypothetical protein
VGTTLACREDGSVDPRLKVGLLVLTEEDEAGTGTTEGLVCGGGDDVAVLEGRALLAGGDKARNVGHVRKEVGALTVGNLAETGVIPVAGVGRTAANDEARLEEVGVRLELGVIEDTSRRVDAVRERLEVDRGGGNLLLGRVIAVGQVTTIREAETHDTVLRIDEGGEGGEAELSAMEISQSTQIAAVDARQLEDTHFAVEPE